MSEDPAKTAPPAAEGGDAPMSKSQQKKLAKLAKIQAAKEKKAAEKAAKEAANPPKEKKKKEDDEEDLDPNQYFENRKNWVAKVESEGKTVYPHKFKVSHSIPAYVKEFADQLKEGDQLKDQSVNVAGRVYLKRASGAKLVFYELRGDGAAVQIMASAADASGYDYEDINTHIKRGDIIGVTGYPGRSKRGELSIFPTKIEILAPCLRMLPDKFKGLKDKEVRSRQRYVDLIVNHENRETFITRSKIVNHIRNYLVDRDFIEVETPMMNVIAGGATAKPFVTFHNALQLPLYMRVAPELYLKRLIVGGLDRVFEIGRNFRNEGIDMTHNPEFTACEFYMAYADHHDLMDMTEEMLSDLVFKLKGTHKVEYHINGPDEPPVVADYSPPFKRIDMIEAVEEAIGEKLPSPATFTEDATIEIFKDICKRHKVEVPPPYTVSRLLDGLVGEFVEPQCISPTFIMHHPEIMSPLAKYHRDLPGLTERFELFCCGKEVANAFTELNNPMVQRQRFAEQQGDADKGDDEAQLLDEDFCVALEYALPPTGGWGLGIDRLTMFLTDNQSIKEVLLFPAMKPEDGSGAQTSEAAAAELAKLNLNN